MRARRAAPAGRLDPLLARERDEVGHDQEVAGVAHREDHAELVVEPLLERRRDRPVAALEAALALGAKPGLDGARRRAPGSAGCATGRAAARGRSSRRCAGCCGSRRGGPGRAPPSAPPTSRRTRRVSNFMRFGVSRLLPVPDAEQDVVRLGLVLADVVEVVGDDQRQPGLGGEPEQLLVEPPLLGQAVVLELEEEAVLAEDVAVLAGDGRGRAPSRRPRGPWRPRRSRQADSPISPALCLARWSRSMRGL